MHFTRLSNRNNDMYEKAAELYKTSFPIFEQRSAYAQEYALKLDEYHFDLIYDENLFVGIILYWETDMFIYVEHFCIDTSLRGSGYGKQALAFLSQKNKKIILEIDPPIDLVSIRRKNFYEKQGYKENPFKHVHPPYDKKFSGHSLVVMSYPTAITQDEYMTFSEYIKETVMRII